MPGSVEPYVRLPSGNATDKRSLAIDVKNPDIAYAVTEGGLHKSTDGGETWKFIPKTGKKELRITAERNKSIRAIASDPSDSSIVYAATPGGKIYKSTDGAATWRVVYQRDIGEPDAKGLRALLFARQELEGVEATYRKAGWDAAIGASGTIIAIHTRDFDYKGHTHHASEDEPQYEIKSDKTDHIAAHKGSALELA